MIVRLIFLVIVVMTVMWLLKRLFSDNGIAGAIESDDKPQTEDMKQCRYCGTHVPESLIVISNDQPYCCQEHADRDQS